MESLARLALAPLDSTYQHNTQEARFQKPASWVSFRGRLGWLSLEFELACLGLLLWTSDGVMRARDKDKTGRRGSGGGRGNLQLTRDLVFGILLLRSSRSIPFLFLPRENAAMSFLFFNQFSVRRTARNQYHFLGGDFHRSFVLSRSLPRRLPCLRVRSFQCRAALPVSRRRLRARRYGCHVMSCHVM